MIPKTKYQLVIYQEKGENHKMKQKTKSTQAEVELRIKKVCEMLLSGKGIEDIVHYSSQNWGVGARQTAKYLKEAKSRIATSVQKDIQYDYSMAVLRYEELFNLNMEKKDYRTAALINKELTALQGLSKQQIDHSVEVTFVCNVPD